MSASGDRKTRQAPDDGILRSGLVAVFMGLLGLLTAFLVVAVRWNDEAGVAALAAVGSTIAAILTAYFGIQYASRAVGSGAADTRKRKPR
jgi:Na+-driven multidrug efflux pump